MLVFKLFSLLYPMTREELNQNDLDKAAKNLLLKMKIPGIEISTLTSTHTHMQMCIDTKLWTEV